MLSSLSKQAEAWGIEIDKNTLIPGNPLHSRIYDRPLGDPLYEKMQFDLITALDVVEHIEDDQSAVDHMMQMLVPGGTLLITVPALPALWTQHDEMNKHFRRYTRQSLTELLAPHGELLDCRYLYTSLALPKLCLPHCSASGPANRVRRRFPSLRSITCSQATARLNGNWPGVCECRLVRH